MFFVLLGWNVQGLVSAGGKTIWGNPAEVASVVQGAAFDVVLDNNGKDLDSVGFVSHIFSYSLSFVI